MAGSGGGNSAESPLSNSLDKAKSWSATCLAEARGDSGGDDVGSGGSGRYLPAMSNVRGLTVSVKMTPFMVAKDLSDAFSSKVLSLSIMGFRTATSGVTSSELVLATADSISTHFSSVAAENTVRNSNRKYDLMMLSISSAPTTYHATKYSRALIVDVTTKPSDSTSKSLTYRQLNTTITEDVKSLKFKG